MTARAPLQVSERSLRNALGRYTTGVTIVACRADDGSPVGLTVNSFAALSLDPPLVLWSLRAGSPSRPAFDAATHFAVNVLAESHLHLSRRFASPLARERFEQGDWTEGLGGAPVLADAAAVLECETASRQPAGDHVLLIGRVLRSHETPAPPLVYQGGHYRRLGEPL